MQTFTQGKIILFLFSLMLLTGLPNDIMAQKSGGMIGTAKHSYSQFRQPVSLVDAEVKKQNTGFETHPELGLLYAGAPCDDCYEVLDKRTEKTKTFAALGTNGSHIWIQSSTEPMHYKNEQGQWLTIQPELAPLPGRNNVFSSVASPWPVTIDARAGFTQIGKPGQRVSFNRELELIFIAPDGTERSLGQGDWSRYTAGDNGVYVTDIWPGMDMEITVSRGGAKTNFLVNRPLPAYAGGQLAIRDHMKMDEGLYLPKSINEMVDGPLEIMHVSGQKLFLISAVSVWERNSKSAASRFSYRIPKGVENKVDIIVPGRWLNLQADAYPVTIDPFFQSTNAAPVTGSDYVASCNSVTGGCTFVNSVPVPPAITVTDLRFSFGFYIDTIPNYAAFDFRVGNCRHPNVPVGNWSCDTANLIPAAFYWCSGVNRTIFDAIKSCIPKPQCPTYNLDVTLRMLRCYRPSPQPCNYTGVFAYDPFVVTVEGWTLEQFEIGVSAPNATICQGDSTILNATPTYGVRPFQYLWTPTGATDSAIVVKPQVNTTYIVEFTDSCGRTARDTVDVIVTPSDNPGFTFAPDSVCPNTPITIKGNDTGQLHYYSWDVPGSAHPALSGIKEFTTTYDVGGVYDIIMWYQSANCKFPDTQQITIHPEVNVEIHDTICDGETYEFYGNYYTSSGTYKYLNQTVFGCDSVLILHLQVNPIPPIPVVSANTPLCYGDDLLLEASEISGATYNWTGPRGFTSTERKPRISAAHFDMAGIYSATSTKLNCVSPQGFVTVVVKPLPEIELHADKTEICSGDSVRLETIANPVYSYQWRPDYYMVTNGTPTAWAVVAYKSYMHVTVTDTGRCVSRDSIYINTEPCCDVFLPDAFTPNGDGKNDAFRIMTDGHLKLSVFRIVNRWGMTVFATGDQYLGWDGTYNGTPQDMDTYHYYLKYGCPDGGIYEKKGSVTLLR